MTYRETNRVVLYSFIMCGVAIVVITWTIGNKFIANPLAALGVNIAIGAVVAFLFERYLEGRINRSIDTLIAKIGRVRGGDLTQRFKEEQDDALPYGLSLELGRMMDFFRETMSDLWKTSAVLIRQLGQLVESAAESLNEFRSEVEYLSSIGQNLEAVRNNITTITKTVSELQVSASNNSAAIGTASRNAVSVLADIQTGQGLMSAVAGAITDMQNFSGNLTGMLNEIGGIGRRVAAAGKSMAELANQSGLIRLNASIDASQQQVSTENYLKLVSEIQHMFENISAIAQESMNTSTFADARIADLRQRLAEDATGLQKSRTATGQADHLLRSVAELFRGATAVYASAVDHAQNLKGSIARVDATSIDFTQTVRASVTKFDKLRADTQITLVKFSELESKITSIRETLRKLEEFKDLFQIA